MKQGGRYGVRLKASAPSIHILRNKQKYRTHQSAERTDHVRVRRDRAVRRASGSREGQSFRLRFCGLQPGREQLFPAERDRKSPA